jgi:uncharacterized protein involved in oxidation of intracellular sulfur
MMLGIVISTADAETVFNALRLGNYALDRGDSVRIFLLGKGVELEQIESDVFAVREQTEGLVERGGKILACGTCLKLRNAQGSEICPLSTMKDLYELIEEADRVVTF